MKTYTYIIFRHGANSANQSLCGRAPACTVDAGSREEACQKASEKISVYGNQWLEAIPWSRCPRWAQEEATNADTEGN